MSLQLVSGRMSHLQGEQVIRGRVRNPHTFLIGNEQARLLKVGEGALP